MSKQTCYISCPIDTYSGYGSRSRDVVKAIIDLDMYDVTIIPQKWGNTPWGFIKDNKKKWGFLEKYYFKEIPKETPDLFIMISVPNEMVRYGKYNILITAGIESTIASKEFIEGCNKADLVLVSSEHSKYVLSNTKVKVQNKNTKETQEIQLNVPIETLFEGVDTDIYKPGIDPKNEIKLPHGFNFLIVGHWLPGVFPHDRKAIGLMVYSFFEAFKNRPNPPNLILKTSIVGGSNWDRYEVIKKIEEVKELYIENNPNVKLPDIYLVHGELTDEEMNALYNHSSIKAMLGISRGEGYGRPLLEFSLVNKPIISSKWSGQLEFLKEEFTTLIPGDLIKIHPSAANNMLLKEAQWFNPNVNLFKSEMVNIFKSYKKYLQKAKRQGYYSRSNFSYEKMKEKIKDILSKNTVKTIPFKI